MGKRLSVIVPAYNAEKYIERCILSITGQLTDADELIIVDDASTDGTRAICEKFCDGINVRLIVHHLQRGEVSSRKDGVEEADGEVVSFIDADDWISSSMYEILLKLYYDKQVECLSSGLIYDYPDTMKSSITIDGADEGKYSHEDVLRELSSGFIYNNGTGRQFATTSVCPKIIDINLVKRSLKMINSELTLGEDGPFALAILLNAKSVYILHQAYYHYEQHMQSINYSFSENSFRQIKKLHDNLHNIISPYHDRGLEEQVDYYVKSYLNDLDKNYLGVSRRKMLYYYPYFDISVNSRVILYGAGAVGQSYIDFIRYHASNLVAWVDASSNDVFERPYLPCSIQEITKLEYDNILLAANTEETLFSMKDTLASYGVDQQKIVSRLPKGAVML